MLNEQTIDKLMDMRLKSMAHTFREQLSNPSYSGLSFEDRFGMIVDKQWADRKSNHIARLTKKATFKFPIASIEDIEYYPDRKLNKELIIQLATCKYINDKLNVIIMGASGAGKTYMGCALGTAACRQLFSVKYIRMPELLADLAIARGEGLYKRVIGQYKKYKLLIFDEWLLTSLNEIEARDLLEIIESRHEESSTIFISQFSAAGWHQRIGEGTIADAVLDRIVHNSYEILIEGDESMRHRKGPNK
jgi:DNA replication protein DnaC